MKNVLILGSGRVSPPIVRYMLDRTDHRVIVASLELEKAEALVGDHPRGVAAHLDVEDPAELESLVREADIVISLVPYAFHVRIAELAIRHKVHMVTTSYVSPEMRELDEAAHEAGVVILNEIGLDPGIDHMSAMKVVDRTRRSGGTITHFSSCCGGFPAPEANTNPWGYKFSWSPRGVILAGRNPARYLRDGGVVDIPGPELFSHRWPQEVKGLGVLEIYPNRDSLQYIDLYGIHNVRNMFRGTMRYPGWCKTLKAVADLGLLDIEERTWPEGTTHRDVVAAVLPAGGGSLVERIADHTGIDPDSRVMSRLEWAGLLSDRPIPRATISPLDIVTERLHRLMTYRSGERDMVVLQHEFIASWPERPTELIISKLVAHGESGGDSAMSLTVSLPAAIAAHRLVEKQLRLTGVQIPVHAEIYNPVMDELESMGIRFEERRHMLLPGPFREWETIPGPRIIADFTA